MGNGPGLVDKDEVDFSKFLTRLVDLFESTKTSHAIWLTHKRLTYDGDDTHIATSSNEEDVREYPCIIKATDGKGYKMSTQINASELPKFHAAYGSLLKSSMTTLKKRDKKKEKARHEKALERRKKLATDIQVVGPKRGAGRRKRQRIVAAVIKQADEREKQIERDEARARKTHPPTVVN